MKHTHKIRGDCLKDISDSLQIDLMMESDQQNWVIDDYILIAVTKYTYGPQSSWFILDGNIWKSISNLRSNFWDIPNLNSKCLFLFFVWISLTLKTCRKWSSWYCLFVCFPLIFCVTFQVLRVAVFEVRHFYEKCLWGPLLPILCIT